MRGNFRAFHTFNVTQEPSTISLNAKYLERILSRLITSDFVI